MLKGRRGAVLGLALFLGLGAFGIWSEISSQHQPQKTESNKSGKHPETNIDPRTPDERIADYTLWLERFTGLLALVSFIQIGFLLRADWTARVSADAAKTAADAAKAQSDLAEKQILLAGRQADISEKQHAVGRLAFLATHRPRLRVRHVSIANTIVFGQVGFFFDDGADVTGGLVVG